MRNSIIVTLTAVVSVLGGVLAESDNFCRDLEDWGPAYNRRVTVNLCRTVMEKNCTEWSDRQCMKVTDIECEVELFTNCSMDWEEYEGVDYIFKSKNSTIKTCHKMIKDVLHEKTVHRCEEVTKKHCTTIWKENEAGEKVWAGQEDDCRDLTWEECKPVRVNVTIPSPDMDCVESNLPYMDYEVVPATLKADSLKCSVDKRSVCKPVEKNKCSRISYTQCEEIPRESCHDVEVLIPTQDVVHKQWCLFDQDNVTDFNEVVRKIPGNTLSFPFGFDIEGEGRSLKRTLDGGLANLFSLSVARGAREKK